MKNRILSIFCFVIIVTIFSGCSTDPNEKANELYVEASQIMQNIKIEAKSYSEAVALYHKAGNIIDQISTQYPSSNLAVSLMSGQTRISGLTLSEFEVLEGFLEPLAEAEKTPLSCALLVVETIEDADDKAEALAKIAVKFAEVGQKEKATQILSQALKTAKTIEDKDKTKPGLDIAESYAKIGQTDKAFQVLRLYYSKNNAFEISGVLREIAVSYAKSGQKEEATKTFSRSVEVAKQIQDPYKIRFKSLALWLIASSYAEAGYFVQAIETAKIIKNKSEKSRALYFVFNYAEANQLPQALEIIKSMKIGLWKARALYTTAVKYAETGQNEKASKILNQALEITRSMGGGLRRKAMVLSEIAVKFAEVGQREKAAQILSQALETARTIKDGDDKAEAFLDIAGGYAKIGLFNQALETAKTIEDADDKAEALLRIAGSYAKIGKKKMAAQILSQAFETTKAMKRSKNKFYTLCEIAESYAKAGQNEKSAQILSQEVEMLAMILKQKPDVYFYADFRSILIDVALQYAKIGHQPNEAALGYLREIVQVVRPINTTLIWQ